ncbi:hypothetical protein AAEU33_20515 [Chryseobacterium sp. Chry.R1]|uniref:hypothetical protein n=1 Tax=Chryseobacterium sp. Chry.R1 TaxID=3139392 RepID=UPI0031F75F0A
MEFLFCKISISKWLLQLHISEISNEKVILPKFKLPSIVGRIKEKKSQCLKFEANQRQSSVHSHQEDNFESETKKTSLESKYVKKDLHELLVKSEMLMEEEEDWRYEMKVIHESGFATGVTFQELNAAGQLLQEDELEPGLEEQSVDILQKIQGTELFSLLEKSLGTASERPTELLNRSYLNDKKPVSSNYDNGIEGFNIREFV